MADMRQFRVGEIGVQDPVSHGTAANTFVDTSAAESIQADAMLRGVNAQVNQTYAKVGHAMAGLAVQAGAQAVDYMAQKDITGSLSLENDDPETHTTFRELAEARQMGMSSEQARTEAQNILMQRKRENPGLANSYQQAYQKYFGGEGAWIFRKTEAEELLDWKLKQGFTQFNINPDLYKVDSDEWNRQFNEHAHQAERNVWGDAIIKQLENGVKFDAHTQKQNLPVIVSAMVGDVDSPEHIGNIIMKEALVFPDGTSILNEDGTISPSNINRAKQNLVALQSKVISGMRMTHPDVDNATFDNMIKPITLAFDSYSSALDGTDVATALSNQNNIMRDTALYNAQVRNPEAANQLAVLTNYTKDLTMIPLDIQMDMVKLTRMLTNPAAGKILNPEEALKTSDLYEDGEIKDALGAIAYTLPHVGADPFSARYANTTVTLIAQELATNPNAVSPDTYNKLLAYVGDVEKFNALDPAVQDIVRQNLESVAPKFISDTLNEYNSRISRAGMTGKITVEFNPTTEQLYAKVKEGAGVQALRAAASINSDLGGANAIFKATSAVLGESPAEALTGSDVGQAAMALMGVTEGADKNAVDSDAEVAALERVRVVDEGIAIAEKYLMDNEMATPSSMAFMDLLQDTRNAGLDKYLDGSDAFKTPGFFDVPMVSYGAVRGQVVRGVHALNALAAGRGSPERQAKILNEVMTKLSNHGVAGGEFNYSVEQWQNLIMDSTTQPTGMDRMMGSKPEDMGEVVVEEIGEPVPQPDPFSEVEITPVNQHMTLDAAASAAYQVERQRELESIAERLGEEIGSMSPAVRANYAVENGTEIPDSVARVLSRVEARGYDTIARVAKNVPDGFVPTKSTIDEVLAAQAKMRRSSAVGKYQVIRSTLQEAVAKLKLDGGLLFNENVQDAIFKYYLVSGKRPAVRAYVEGTSEDVDAALLDLAKEFASFPIPTDMGDKKAGDSYYAGDGLNASHLSIEDAKAFLLALRNGD